MLENLSIYIDESVSELQDRLNVTDVVLAEKKTAKQNSEYTAAYVAGGITIAAAAIGAVYLLKKRQERKGIEESLMGSEYVRSEAIL